MKDLVSIIIPCYNSEKYIEQTIKSALNQTYTNIDIIIIDDGSYDNSKKIVLELQKEDPRIKYFYQKNSGVSEARNYGIEVSKGVYISFLDSDDLYENTKVEKQVKLLENEIYDVAYCGHLEVNPQENDSVNRVVKYNGKGNILNDYILQKAFIHINSWLIKKDLIRIYNIKFINGMTYGEDSNFSMKLLTFANVIGTEEPLTKYRIYNLSASFKIQNRLNYQKNYITEYIDWLDKIESKQINVKDIKTILNNFLLPIVTIRNIIFSKRKKSDLSEYEKEILSKFRPNIKNLKTSFRFYQFKNKIK